jgi:hypothetical protein
MIKYQDRDVTLLLTEADPTGPAPSALDDRARMDLDGILATRASRHAVKRRRWTGIRTVAIAATAAAAGLFAVALAGGGSGDTAPAYAATPRALVATPIAGADAHAFLNHLAEKVAKLPDDVGTGDRAVLRRKGWYLSTTVSATGSESEIRPEVTREIADDQPWKLGSLSPDPETLARQLERAGGGSGEAVRLEHVEMAYGEMPIPPKVRAALLRYVAETPDLQVDGKVTDRAGRVGVAVSVETDDSGLPSRQMLIVDPNDGRLLGTEEMLTETAGKLNVPIPSVTSYTIFLDSRYEAG